jgi:hypothetical protein
MKEYSDGAVAAIAQRKEGVSERLVTCRLYQQG